VVEHTWSFKVESIGTDGVTPGEKHDAIGGKELVCDECGFGGWLDESLFSKLSVFSKRKGRRI
jgi:hypothetical protein